MLKKQIFIEKINRYDMAVDKDIRVYFDRIGGTSSFTYSFGSCKSKRNTLEFIKEHEEDTWITVEETDNQIIEVSASENNKRERSARVGINLNGKHCADFDVSQDGINCECGTAFTTRQRSDYVPVGGGGHTDLGTYSFSSDCVTVSTVGSSSVSWISAITLSNDGHIYGDIEKSNEVDSRSGEITVSAQMISDESTWCYGHLTIWQDGTGCICGEVFKVTPITATLPPQGGVRKLADYTIVNPSCVTVQQNGSSNKAWVHDIKVGSNGEISGTVETYVGGRESQTATITVSAKMPDDSDCISAFTVTQNFAACTCDDIDLSGIVFSGDLPREGFTEERQIGTWHLKNGSLCGGKPIITGLDGIMVNNDHTITLLSVEPNTSIGRKEFPLEVKFEGTNKCLDVTLYQSGKGCECEDIHSNIKQEKYLLPVSGATDLYIGSGDTNGCGDIVFISKCTFMTLKRVYDDEEAQTTYKIYADVDEYTEVSPPSRACAHNFKIILKGGGEKTCENLPLHFKQTHNYCECTDFSIQPITNDYVSYDADTKTFTMVVPREWNSYSYLEFYDHDGAKCNFGGFLDVKYIDDAEEDWIEDYSSHNTYGSYFRLRILDNEKPTDREATATLKIYINKEDDFLGESCGEYKLEIKQKGYGDCCQDYTLTLDCPTSSISPEGTDGDSTYRIDLGQAYPLGCLLGKLKVRLYEYYDGFNPSQDCDNLDYHTNLLFEYTLSETPHPEGGALFELTNGDPSQEANFWFRASDMTNSASAIWFIVAKNEGEERNVIVYVSFDECYQSSCCAIAQAGKPSCTCEVANPYFQSGSKVGSTTVNGCGGRNCVYIYYNKEYCETLTFNYELYKDVNLTEPFTDDWIYNLSFINADSRKQLCYTLKKNEDVERVVYIKVMIDELGEECNMRYKVTQKVFNCDAIKNMISCYGASADWNEGVAYIALLSSYDSSCGDISATTLYQWSGDSSYSQADEITWINRVYHDSSYYNDYMKAQFDYNYYDFKRNATFKVFLVDSNKNPISADTCYVECTITQKPQETQPETCLCGTLSLEFTPEEANDSGYILLDSSSSAWQRVGTMRSDRGLCSRNYFCYGNDNFIGILSYKIEYESGRHVLYAQIDQDHNTEIKPNVNTDVMIFLYLSNVAVEDNIKPQCGTSLDEACDEKLLHILFY